MINVKEKEKNRYRIRTMDTAILRRVAEYCEVHGIECWKFDDGVNPYTIRFITDYDTYKKILFFNGLNEH